MSLLYIGQQVTIYGGLFIVIIGVIGNGINILVFSSVRTYRTIPCTFYFLIASIFNLIYITINLISRIISVGYGIDLTRTSVIWCRIRLFCLATFSLVSLSCSCIATIDQYLTTSKIVCFRRFSNIKRAHRIIMIIIIIWCLHGIPNLLYYDISPITKTCVNTNPIYAIYIPIYLFSLVCVIPSLVLIIFGYLTYRNIHLIRVLAKQQADRQLTRMVLIQVIFVVICLVPYSINNGYNLITSRVSKDTDRLSRESFATTILTLVCYFYNAGSCYVFLISSSRFRRATKHLVFFYCLKVNQVIPLQRRILGTPMV